MTDIHPCNCGTCDKYSETLHPVYEGNILCFCGDDRTQIETKSITKAHGCLSHPQAREYLMQDVLEELEKRKSPEYYDGFGSAFWKAGIDEAIALIKEGVKK